MISAEGRSVTNAAAWLLEQPGRGPAGRHDRPVPRLLVQPSHDGEHRVALGGEEGQQSLVLRFHRLTGHRASSGYLSWWRNSTSSSWRPSGVRSRRMSVSQNKAMTGP